MYRPQRCRGEGVGNRVGTGANCHDQCVLLLYRAKGATEPCPVSRHHADAVLFCTRMYCD